MEMTFRWYGKDDPVKLEYIKQIPGMKGIVTAIYDIPVGEVWPLERSLELKKEIDNLNNLKKSYDIAKLNNENLNSQKEELESEIKQLNNKISNLNKKIDKLK